MDGNKGKKDSIQNTVSEFRCRRLVTDFGGHRLPCSEAGVFFLRAPQILNDYFDPNRELKQSASVVCTASCESKKVVKCLLNFSANVLIPPLGQ